MSPNHRLYKRFQNIIIPALLIIILENRAIKNQNMLRSKTSKSQTFLSMN